MRSHGPGWNARPREVPRRGHPTRGRDMAPQQLATAAMVADSPYTGRPVSSVPEVIARLDQIQTYAEAHEVRGQHDGVACFSFLYQRITSRVLEGINSGRFADGQFVTLLDVVFA